MKRLSLFCGLLLALLLSVFSASASAEYRIVVATDPHYISPALTDGGLCRERSGRARLRPYELDGGPSNHRNGG